MESSKVFNQEVMIFSEMNHIQKTSIAHSYLFVNKNSKVSLMERNSKGQKGDKAGRKDSKGTNGYQRPVREEELVEFFIA